MIDFCLILADTAGETLQQGLYPVGGLAGLLAYFVYRLEPRLRSMEYTIQQASKVQLLQTIAVADAQNNGVIVEQAKAIIKEIDDSGVKKP